MAEWYVKAFGKISGVSVQTLHHYDRIDLLKPSLRLANGYRLYSEGDLLRLQQIVALKFFGFELEAIKHLLSESQDIEAQFSAQAKVLEEQANHCLTGSETLKKIVADTSSNESIPWQTVIKTIEVFRMKQTLENTWAQEVLTEAELSQYAEFQQSWESRCSREPELREDFIKNRTDLLKQIEVHLDKDPRGEEGLELGKQWMVMINGIYGPEHANLKQAVWEKGFKQGKIDADRGLDPKMVQWLDAAIDHYYVECIKDVLAQIKGNETEDSSISLAWEALMEEMCGTSLAMRQSIYDAVLVHEEVNKKAKTWLAACFGPK